MTNIIIIIVFKNVNFIGSIIEKIYMIYQFMINIVLVQTTVILQ